MEEAAEIAHMAEMDLVGYLDQLRAGDPYDARRRACLLALRDIVRMRGDEEDVEHWATEFLAARRVSRGGGGRSPLPAGRAPP